jgi:hypothetical protein
MSRARPLSILLTAGAILAMVTGAVGSTTAAGAAPPGPQAAQTCSQSFLPLPDPACTPGAKNPDVTQSTIDSTICVSGWTATVRPPTSYTNPLKAQQIGEYGYTDTNISDYEEDHFIPLELGGAPRDAKNLWPEPWNAPSGETAGSKDSVENKLKALVCDGSATLAAAQKALVADWQTAVAVATG